LMTNDWHKARKGVGRVFTQSDNSRFDLFELIATRVASGTLMLGFTACCFPEEPV
jgi:hypothetical protein